MDFKSKYLKYKNKYLQLKKLQLGGGDSTKLIDAINNADGKLIQELIAQNIDVNEKDENGKTALFYAIGLGDFDLLKLLFKKGANINLKDNKGQTPLMYAIGQNLKNSRIEIIELLLLLNKNININEKDNMGDTALMIATLGNQLEVVKLLLEKGANVNEKNNNGTTALMNLAKAYYTPDTAEVAKLLLCAGAKINDFDKDYNSIITLLWDKHDYQNKKLGKHEEYPKNDRLMNLLKNWNGEVQ
jgi:ankyrin repeat protein